MPNAHKRRRPRLFLLMVGAFALAITLTVCGLVGFVGLVFAGQIPNSDLRDRIRALKARHILVISDACFSGSLFAERAVTPDLAIEELSRLSSRTAMTSGALTTVPDRSVFVKYLLQKLSENAEEYLLAQLRHPAEMCRTR